LYELNLTLYECLKVTFHVTVGRTACLNVVSVIDWTSLYSPVSRPVYVASYFSVFKNVECCGKRCRCDKYRNHDKQCTCIFL